MNYSTLQPPRLAFGDGECDALDAALRWYALARTDPGHAGEFERRYCASFCALMGGGFADAVATGTAALFIAIAALDLPPYSTILTSPITDPGTLAAIILNGHRPRVVDSADPLAFNISLRDIYAVLHRKDALLMVHALGRPATAVTGEFLDCPVVEDCSQAHGARLRERPVGSWGTIAAFSTMSRKAHITGGCGGVVWTRNEALHHRALAHADRGKPSWLPSFNDRDPRTFLFPALNLHSNELSCAIGVSSLSRLENTRQRRLAFLNALSEELTRSRTLSPSHYTPDDSPFVFPLWVREGVNKRTLGKALVAAGIGLNPDYDAYLVRSWPWLAPYLPRNQVDTPNARRALARSLMLYLNENYTPDTARAIVDVICRVEKENPQ